MPLAATNKDLVGYAKLKYYNPKEKTDIAWHESVMSGCIHICEERLSNIIIGSNRQIPHDTSSHKKGYVKIRCSIRMLSESSGPGRLEGCYRKAAAKHMIYGLQSQTELVNE